MTSQTSYTCGHCQKSVSKDSTVCPHCGARLVGIKCRNCGFSGARADFQNDLCPKCGSAVTAAAPARCPKCKARWDSWFCEKCGRAGWGRVVWFSLFGLAGVGAIVSFVHLYLGWNALTVLITLGISVVPGFLLYAPVRTVAKVWKRRKRRR